MFSPLNDPKITNWFNRLDAAWRRLPEAERTRQREEVRQHLEALAAAKITQGQMPEFAWAAALVQFGDPTRIGRKLYREWKQSKVGFRAEMSAILYGLALILLLGFVETIPLFLWQWAFYGGTFVVYIAVGRRYPLQAIKGAFYVTILCNTWNLLGSALAAAVHMEIPQLSITAFHPVYLLAIFISLFFHPSLAYFASVTKRGWYRPTLADFKLTLPTRRQISR